MDPLLIGIAAALVRLVLVRLIARFDRFQEFVFLLAIGWCLGLAELANALGMPLADYQKLLQDTRGHQLISFEDLVEDGDEEFLERHLSDDRNEPSKLLEDESLRRALVQGIELLPEREKMMMALYYEQDLNLREIGEVMGVTESRVCQLHSQAVARLRARIFGDAGIKKKKAKQNG